MSLTEALPFTEFSSTLWVLIGLSVLVLGLSTERWQFLNQQKKRLIKTYQHIQEHLQQGDTTMAQAVNQSLPPHGGSPLFQSLLHLLSKPSTFHAQTLQIELQRIRRSIQQTIRRSQQRLWIIGTIGALAPFVGLLGTVLGVMQAFSAMADQGGGFQVVSSGLSEALITTAAGIFVGIEAVLFFNALKVYSGHYAYQLKDCCEDLIETIHLQQNGKVS